MTSQEKPIYYLIDEVSFWMCNPFGMVLITLTGAFVLAMTWECLFQPIVNKIRLWNILRKIK